MRHDSPTLTETDSNVLLEARQRHEAFVEAAGKLDDQLRALALALIGFRTSAAELTDAMRAAGRGDDGYIDVSMNAAIRSAVWKHAHDFAERAHVHRTQLSTAQSLVTYAIRVTADRLA